MNLYRIEPDRIINLDLVFLITVSGPSKHYDTAEWAIKFLSSGNVADITTVFSSKEARDKEFDLIERLRFGRTER